MKIECLHGFFIFKETKPGQISDFIKFSGLSITKWREHFTFTDLELAPNYSIQGGAILGVPSIATFEGEPWEVFEENGLVYDFSKGLVVPIISVTQTISMKLAGNKFVSSGLILPGSLDLGGRRVSGYSAWFSKDTLKFTYSEVKYV